MGTTYSDLIYEYAGGIPDGKKLLAFAPSGPSSGYLPASMASLPLDWDAVAADGSMVGSGAIVVCAEGRCMLDMALNATRFFRNESCGKCVPCRMGSQKMVEMLKGWTEGRSSTDDMQMLDELSVAMRQDLHLRLGPGRTRANRIDSCPLSRGGGRPLDASPLPGRCVLHGGEVAMSSDASVNKAVSSADHPDHRWQQSHRSRRERRIFDAARMNGIQHSDALPSAK